MPSWRRPLAFIRRASRLRVIPSVPIPPITVVTPASSIWLRYIEGVREAGPPSPPAPAMCTWLSIRPGIILKPEQSITVSPRFSGIRISSATATMLFPAMSTSLCPRGWGPNISQLLKSNMGKKFLQDQMALFKQTQDVVDVIIKNETAHEDHSDLLCVFHEFFIGFSS